jgi:hypothetical protein
MRLAIRMSALGIETLSLQILVAHSALEAVAVIRRIQRLYPSVACLNRKLARNTFCREQLIPIWTGQNYLFYLFSIYFY